MEEYLFFSNCIVSDHEAVLKWNILNRMRGNKGRKIVKYCHTRPIQILYI